MEHLTGDERVALIRAEAYRLGFSACGFAEAKAVPKEYMQAYQSWLDRGWHGEMHYLASNMALRTDPRELVPGTRTIIVVAMNYYPVKRQAEHLPQFASYAYGRDYHRVVKKRLDSLLSFIQTNIDSSVQGRAFADSAPVLERYWAVEAGLGWRGKHGLLILPRAGSFFFLGELFISIELPPSTPMTSYCGGCSRCLQSCPTGALIAPGLMDARKCISYLTIEQKEEIPQELAAKMGNRIYGCDACQTCCPWNRFSVPTEVEDFALREVLETLTPERLEAMSEEEFDKLFAGSAIRRAGLSGLKRSLRAIGRNMPETTEP